jgi:hypothetical protein
LSASPFFYPPQVTQAANVKTNGQFTVTFQSTVGLQPDANLSKNGSF